MIKDIFFNFTTLVSFTYLISQFFIYMRRFEFRNLNVKVCYGIAGGFLAMLLMTISVQVSDKIIFDFRHLTILVVATFGGFSSALITGIIIFIFRIFYFGITMDSIVAASNMLIVALGCGMVSKLRIRRLIKWIYMNIIALVVISISFFTRIPNKTIVLHTIIIFWVSSIIVGLIVYFMITYILWTEKLFRQIKYESEYDFLTGLKNVRTFNHIMDSIEKITDNKYEKLSVLFIDIDFFKKVNDTYGHEAGDKVLKEFGKIFSDLFIDTDMTFRIGGEEFVVILPNCECKKAIDIAERIRRTYENHIFYIKDSLRVKITVSIGVSSFPETIDNMKSLVPQADRALYKAKENGRNRVEVS